MVPSSAGATEIKNWQNWSHLNGEAGASAVASEKMATIIGSTTGRLQTKVNHVELILRKTCWADFERWFTANCGLHFKEVFLNRTDCAIHHDMLPIIRSLDQWILHGCFNTAGKSYLHAFSLAGWQKVQTLQSLLFCVFMFTIYRPVVSGERCLLPWTCTLSCLFFMLWFNST